MWNLNAQTNFITSKCDNTARYRPDLKAQAQETGTHTATSQQQHRHTARTFIQHHCPDF